MGDADGIGAGNRVCYMDLFHVIPNIIAGGRGRSRIRRIERPGQQNGATGSGHPYIKIVDQHKSRRVDHRGRWRRRRIVPGQGGPQRRRAVADEIIGQTGPVAQGVFDNMVGINGDRVRAHKIRRCFGIHEAPPEGVIRSVGVTRFIRRVNYQRFHRRRP